MKCTTNRFHRNGYGDVTDRSGHLSTTTHSVRRLAPRPRRPERFVDRLTEPRGVVVRDGGRAPPEDVADHGHGDVEELEPLEQRDANCKTSLCGTVSGGLGSAAREHYTQT